MRPAAEAESLGIPSVVVTTTGFSVLAGHAGKAAGITDLRVAEYPGPVGIHDSQRIAANIEAVLVDRIVAGLTGSATASRAASAGTAWEPSRTVFAGTADQINRHFQENDWTDGLPIVPPTVERVRRFLAFTDRAPDDQIAVLQSANLKAVPWNVAANAVMAGCRPQHMPLIVAAVEALGDDRCSLNNIGSTSGLLPFLLFNGPLAKELGLVSSGQLIARGANPALGRAIGLIVRNVAGYRPGKSYMGTFGYPLVFALAEDEAASPWQPFHVDQGFAREASTVTVGVTCNWGPQPEVSSTPEQSGAVTALELLRKAAPKMARLYDFPTHGPKAEKSMITLLLSPPVARSLSEAGYSKEAVRQHVYENTVIRLGEFDWITRYTYPSQVTLQEKVAAGILPPEFAGSPDDMVRLIASTDMVHVVVCGDSNRNRVMALEGGHTQPTTKEVRLPKDWNALVAAERSRDD